MTTSGDEALEPVELIRKSGAVLRMGKAMLSSGTGSYRVKSAMQQVARAFGLDPVAARPGGEHRLAHAQHGAGLADELDRFERLITQGRHADILACAGGPGLGRPDASRLSRPARVRTS